MAANLPERADDSLRAGNADREQVVARLNAAFAEGRLDVNELDERLKATYGAKTRGELRPLTVDLPEDSARRPLPATPARRGTEPAPAGHRGVPTEIRVLFGVWLTAVLVNLVIWAAVSIGDRDPAYFWPIWVAGPWGIVLIWQTVGGLSRQEPQAWQAKLDKAERKKQAKRERKALEAEAIARGELPPKPKKKSD